MAAAGVAKIDLLGFDACYMAAYETLASVQDLAHYVLASEETEPGHGWQWQTFNKLVTTPTVSKAALSPCLPSATDPACI